MTTYLVTRHPGTRTWATRQGLTVDRVLDHLEPADLAALQPGDVVIGSLPIHLAAQLCARGARFVNLSLDMARNLRGQELDAADLERLGARLEGYRVQARPLPAALPPDQAPQVQVCILSDQLLPNLIPVLQARPVQVYALASEAMTQRGIPDRFSRLLEEAGIPCRTLTDLPHRLDALQDYAATLVNALASRHRRERLVLNATGGSKLMSLALVDAFRNHLSEPEILYTDTAAGQLVSLTTGRGRPLEPVLDIPLALAANGVEYLNSHSDDPLWEAQIRRREPLTRWLVDHIGQLADTPQGKPGFLSRLNRLLNAALDDKGLALVQPTQRFSTIPRGLWREALERAQGCELLTLDDDDPGTFHLFSLKAAAYLRGGWLEEYAWLCAADLQPHHQALGVRVEWQGDSLRPGENELDLVMVHRNRTLLVECKTGRLARGEEREQGVLALLNSLGRHATGSLGTTWLLSAQPLTEAAHDRADHYRVRLVEHTQLAQLPLLMREWMSG